MPAAREDVTRRPVVPDAAGRSLWFAAAWTGVGAAVVGATLGIAAVAVCWMPSAGASGHAISTIRAGLLTFLASVHGGITVDGTPTRFLPLGMLLVLALTAWRAGAGLADAAAEIGERDAVRLALAGAAQAAAFSAACTVAVPFARLGTSAAPLLGVAGSSLLLFAVSGGVSFVRSSPLAARAAGSVPAWAVRSARAAAAALCVYLASGALLVAGSLAVHHARVDVLAAQAGSGWSGVPVLLLGVLAAPNAVVAATSYLAGPGFSVGVGTTVSALGTAHGVVPAFPVLGALPTGSGATPAVWVLMVATPLLAGAAAVRMVAAAGTWPQRLRELAAAAGITGVALAVLAWQGGGSVGPGRLAAVGASPWQLLLAGAVALAVGCGPALAVQAARSRFAGLVRHEPSTPVVRDRGTRSPVAVRGRRTEGDGTDAAPDPGPDGGAADGTDDLPADEAHAAPADAARRPGTLAG